MVDAFTMSAVWLVDSFDEWVLGGILVGDFASFVFGAVIDDNDLNILSERNE